MSGLCQLDARSLLRDGQTGNTSYMLDMETDITSRDREGFAGMINILEENQDIFKLDLEHLCGSGSVEMGEHKKDSW